MNLSSFIVNYCEEEFDHQQPEQSKSLKGSVDGKRGSLRVKEALKRAFPFNRDFSSMLTELAFQTKSEDSDDFLYTDLEYSMVERSAYVTFGLMDDVFLWSQGHQTFHFIGTGSCMIQARRPAAEVAFGVNHGLYLKKWRDHAYYEDECDRRHFLAGLLGSEMERRLWLETGMSAHGPWQSCVRVWKGMLEDQNQSTVIRDFIANAPLEFQICDEIEEFLGGDIARAGNWKRRPDSHFESLKAVAQLRGAHSLAQLVEATRQFTQSLFPKFPSVFFTELTPHNHSHLFETTETSAEAHVDDLKRYEHLIMSGRDNRRILPHNVNKNDIPTRLKNAIKIARSWCDAVDSNKMNYTQYISEMEKLEKSLLYCEKYDKRFKEDKPFPAYPASKFTYPDSVKYDYDTEVHRASLLKSLHELAGKKYWEM